MKKIIKVLISIFALLAGFSIGCKSNNANQSSSDTSVTSPDSPASVTNSDDIQYLDPADDDQLYYAEYGPPPDYDEFEEYED